MIQTLIWTNALVCLGHVVLQSIRGDVNWLRIGERSALSTLYIGLEGTLILMLVALLFEHFYPDMKKLAASRLTHIAVIVMSIEITVWLLYR